MATACAFLDALVADVPTGSISSWPTTISNSRSAGEPIRAARSVAGHPFDQACQVHGIEHRLTGPKHPEPMEVERMNRTSRRRRRTHDHDHALLRAISKLVAA